METIALFPFMDYEATGLQDRSVLQKDSVNKRVLEVLAKKLNFTYGIYEAPMKTTGVEDKNGNYNGLMGQLQREEADLSSILALTLFRFKVADFVRICPTDKVTVISLKPTLLPQHLAIVRPFAGEVWSGVGIGVVVWGITVWLLQSIWQRFVGRLQVQFSTYLLYGWGALTEQPPRDPSVNASGQMLVGWWLVFCLIISTGFKSSLIAHLTVQGKTRPIETLRDLVDGDGWRRGSPLLKSIRPLIRRVDDTGLLSYWMDKVKQRRVTQIRAVAKPSKFTEALKLDDTREVVLGLDHVQGAFYLLFLGSGVALLFLVGENLTYYTT
ncbi:hypothetical protein Pcinc_032575 [Petrolisthes cinctipes]|uniref:Uncharacterized protein n=1 Tax=Petrolisthes cinctipes TaxID=88211 RepID=A0AAE1EUH2_PETCI|nr:hypothetical protein Pcinc_032575 [Petrolisthes cinctipes]